MGTGLVGGRIGELEGGGMEAGVWKSEGLDRREDCVKVVSAARRTGRDKVGCIVLGRGEDDKKVREWLKTAAQVPGFICFAVGRTSFWVPLIDWRAKKKATREGVSQDAPHHRLRVGSVARCHDGTCH